MNHIWCPRHASCRSTQYWCVVRTLFRWSPGLHNMSYSFLFVSLKGLGQTSLGNSVCFCNLWKINWQNSSPTDRILATVISEGWIPSSMDKLASLYTCTHIHSWRLKQRDVNLNGLTQTLIAFCPFIPLFSEFCRFKPVLWWIISMNSMTSYM